ncbi:MAG: short-subunit dehydrogenase [Candidatus Azotimanducaceae bacterium]|jgi:short-subunit dehydrogenase
MSTLSTQKTVVVFGATSAIAQETCRLHAPHAIRFVLCARDSTKLDIVASDIRSRGEATISTHVVDFSDPSNYANLFELIKKENDAIDIWYFFHGNLPEQKKCEASLSHAKAALQTNVLSILDLLHPVANDLEKQKSGTLVVVSSVAGDRGRASNYMYGTAKGALSIYLQGLRNRLAVHGITVLDVKPGFVKTPMTAHLDNSGFLWASPDAIAADIVAAVKKKSDVIYTPGYWRLIMFVIRAVPEKIFKRLSL